VISKETAANAGKRIIKNQSILIIKKSENQ